MYDDLAMAAEFLKEISDTQSFALLDDPHRAAELRETLFRIEQRATLLGKSFKQRNVNERLRRSAFWTSAFSSSGR
ncbi:hypothetical protein [Phyllobacterium sp. P30BS-XVII]|uniref:hypothetical protein n=1 Tax=Phyllobacterium sp. P30BS-XVII TaxID=2587046 RepID=UPI0017F09AC9|nr:hypothetical protein [Phyllobacterium sp. P30BS-XVII]MBA8903875.1 hypothetical protein [Phyllobacterium sp. P30BS-XVII]